jgi:hypothetical protein
MLSERRFYFGTKDAPILASRSRSMSAIGRMMTKQFSALLLLVIAVSAGDAGAQLYAKPVTAPEVIYEMDGYSVLPPPGKNWFELERDQKYAYFGKKLESRTHSFIAMALSAPMREKFEKPEEFRDYVSKMLALTSDERNAVIESGAALDGPPERFCVRHYTKAVDRKAVYAAGRALLVETIGVSCLHPDNRALSVDVSYTERGDPAETNLELRAEGESFVRSLKFISR